ncbi:hypothetical protein AUK04_00585 [Candidatus Roizmanbacteria bacterium CG2_30_33_16]|uniref:ChsH2 C-terminal OB-fold domain-containing protein n=3 Tax=Candidatus Roizmaniibacteriota TaxID=1752723 RepID=A0A2M7E456_9BACT|nr:MAG: hypothetical protein AUK04_00585 [Candidatus Roizmanbacteria bacterium CG2_30_33_16]PIV62488.1 MAG: hypothetical protein COS12_02240 [Candidatus Roizmanbacteria bacterium CG01_land_8_20_14_3_00_33_9]PJB89224.1 MAG: hypothetical protein CO083_01035 [Candidatus Roizmanbacteria bacterium CG_4_9_14_0_8_um_filter_34_12]
MISPVKIWRRQKKIKKVMNKIGKITSWTIVYVPPSDFKKYAPYPVVLVELENNQKMMGQLVDYEKNELKVGQLVRTVLRKTQETAVEDVIAYGLKFKPINQIDSGRAH